MPGGGENGFSCRGFEVKGCFIRIRIDESRITGMLKLI